MPDRLALPQNRAGFRADPQGFVALPRCRPRAFAAAPASWISPGGAAFPRPKQNYRTAVDWHIKCLVITGRWWPGRPVAPLASVPQLSHRQYERLNDQI